LIHLLDATALIALNQVMGICTPIKSAEVLDVVLKECHHPALFDSKIFLETTGLTTVETLPGWLHDAKSYHSFQLSSQDSLNLYYAKMTNRTLVTESCVLQGFCDKNQIEMQSYSSWLEKICPK
jgi:hypothetical protein